jgi:hypothetical protein
MFKKTSAKKRFREAKAAGDKRGMSDAAAEMIQGVIRVKQSRKRIEAQRIIKAQWLRDGNKLQNNIQYNYDIRYLVRFSYMMPT